MRRLLAALLALFVVGTAQAQPYWRDPSGGRIGGAVVGGTANQVLYVDSSGNLAGSASLVYDDSTKRLTVGTGVAGTLSATNLIATTLSYAGNVDLVSSGNINVRAAATSITLGAFAVTPASSGTRFICINTSGVISSSAAACSGT